MQFQTKILIVDRPSEMLELMCAGLKKSGFQVLVAATGEEGLKTAKEELPQVVITELVLEDTDGIEWCQRLRENKCMQETFIIILTSHSEVYSQIAALNSGADDYLLKPVNQRLLLSKVNAMLRRYVRTNVSAAMGGFQIDQERYLIRKGSEEIHLPRKEFELISLLASKPRKVFTRDEIKNELWELPDGVNNRTIDVHIRKLREKVGENLIHTVKGVGYKVDA